MNRTSPGKLTEFLREVRTERAWHGYDEEDAVHFLILPVLTCLGWRVDEPSEVCRPFKVGSGLVDFRLQIKESTAALLEAKRPSERLDVHERQLLLYAFEYATPVAILTNGVRWWFYLPMAAGLWRERRFADLDLSRDSEAQHAR